MSRPQLKLPKKSTAYNTEALLDISTSSLKPMHAGKSKSTSDVSTSPIAGVVATPLVSERTMGSMCYSEQARLEQIAKRILGRFRPVSQSWFFTYAKSLMRLTDESLNRSRDTLAKIYRYRDLHEIMQVLTQRGDSGPFDEDISADDWETDIVQAALIERKDRTIDIIQSRNPNIRYDPNTVCTSDEVYCLGLFNTPSTHRISVRELDLPKRTSLERRMRRSAFDIES